MCATTDIGQWFTGKSAGYVTNRLTKRPRSKLSQIYLHWVVLVCGAFRTSGNHKPSELQNMPKEASVSCNRGDNRVVWCLKMGEIYPRRNSVSAKNRKYSAGRNHEINTVLGRAEWYAFLMVRDKAYSIHRCFKTDIHCEIPLRIRLPFTTKDPSCTVSNFHTLFSKPQAIPC